jgi:glycosyltransferase involved in cell wall biosynthesis
MYLRITFICPPDNPSGGMRVIALYATKLHQRGHEVVVAIPQTVRPTSRQRISAFIKRGVIIRTEKPNPISFFRNAPFEVRWLTRQGSVTNADVPDADVIIGTWWETVEWIWPFNASKGIKLHFMQDYEVWGHPDFIDIPRIDAAYARPIPKIVIAEWEKKLLETKWGISPIAIIPNGVDAGLFHAPPRGKQPVPTVGFTYSTIFDKGCNVMLSAIEEARRSHPDLRVISFGATRPKEEFPDWIEFCAAVPDNELKQVYSSCDAWLFGTRREGFGLPILEAMACRTPVIGTPAGAGQDIISQGGGFLVPIDDPKAMADAIVRFARMPENTWRSISDIAINTAARYSWTEATDRFESVLHSLTALPG